MKKILAILMTIIGVCFVTLANADEYEDLRTKFSAARTSLVVMVFHKDQRGPEQQKLVKDTADEVSAQLAKMKAPAGKKGKFIDLVNTWNSFKETRETELVPALVNGEEQKARLLVWGVQKQRYTKCMALLSELDSNMAAGKSTIAVDIENFRVKLNAARDSLLVMLHYKNKRGPEQQQLVKDTADAVSAQLEKMSVAPEAQAQYLELVGTWKALRETREQELVPAILEGKDEEARKITYGIQRDRLKMCVFLAGEIGK